MATKPTRAQLEKKIRDLEKQVAGLEQTEQALQHSESLLRIFVENAPVSVVMCDNQMRWLAYSRQLLKDYQLEDKDYVGLNHYDIVPDIPPHWQQDHQKVLSGDCVSVNEERITRDSGQVEWVRRELLPWRDSHGDIGGILIFNEIITKRKQAEEALRISEVNYRELFNAQPDAIVIVDGRTRRIVDVNPSAQKLYGYSRDDMIGLDPVQLSSEPEKTSDHIRRVVKNLSKGIPSVVEERLHKKKDGTVFPVELLIGPVTRDSETMICAIIRDISERQRKEQALKALQLQQEAILDNIPDYAWLKDRESRFIAVNQAFGAACGCPPEELVGKTDFYAWPNKLAERYRADDKEVIESGLRKIVEEPLTSADGRRKWLETIKTPIINEAGDIVGTAGIARDITNRIQAVEALKESEERFSKAFYNSPDIIVITRVSDGLILDVNESVLRVAGYTREELIGHTTIELNLWVDLEDRARYLDALDKAGSLRDMEFRFRLKSGEIRIGQVSGSLIHLGGDLCVLAVVRDITDQKQASEALQAETERLSVTLQSIGDGVITTDKDGRIMLLNRIAERLTGWNGSDAVGMPLDQVFRIVNEYSREPCENPVQHVLSSGRIVGFAENSILISKDGREIVIADSGAPILDSEKRIIGVVLVFRDITESRKMEKEILKVEKLESLGVLAGGIAHDFNNFLSGILGNLSLAKLEAKIDEPIYPILEEMEQAALRAKNLTQQLLTFSKGGDPIRMVANLTHLVKESALFAARGSNVRCEFSLGDKVVYSDIDEGQIAQVIHNLILNAIQAMPDGGGNSNRGRNSRSAVRQRSSP